MGELPPVQKTQSYRICFIVRVPHDEAPDDLEIKVRRRDEEKGWVPVTVTSIVDAEGLDDDDDEYDGDEETEIRWIGIGVS